MIEIDDEDSQTTVWGGLSNAERLWRIRHSASHVLAAAVLDLYPTARLAIGGPTERGFYYDFELPVSLTPGDLEIIEVAMMKHIKSNDQFETWTVNIDDAIAYFESRDQPYKVELICDLR